MEIQKTDITQWSDRARYRKANRRWLKYSGKIALRILAAIEDTPGMNQKKLAELAEVTPQQVSKIVKGHENLTLQTISKFSEILGRELIDFPSFKYNEVEGFHAVVVYQSIQICFKAQSLEVINTHLYHGELPSSMFAPIPTLTTLELTTQQ
jgi:transcriptional regulator with XRE-family HTH domain